jgi:hypothetical protein
MQRSARVSSAAIDQLLLVIPQLVLPEVLVEVEIIAAKAP